MANLTFIAIKIRANEKRAAYFTYLFEKEKPKITLFQEATGLNPTRLKSKAYKLIQSNFEAALAFFNTTMADYENFVPKPN